MVVASDYEVICSQTEKILPGDMEMFSFSLPPNLRHTRNDSEIVINLTFNVVKAEDLKWEVVLNDATESQFVRSGSSLFTWQLFAEAAQLHPGGNQIGVYVRPRGRGLLEVQGITLQYRVDL